MNKQFFTSREVAELTKSSIVVVSRWAKNHDIKRDGSLNGILLYKWTLNDIERFKQRKRGRKKR